MSDVWEDVRKSGGEETTEVFPSPVGGRGPGVTWFQLIQLLLIAGAVGGGFTALKVGQDATNAKVEVLSQQFSHMQNTLDEYTKAVIGQMRPPSPPKQ